MPPEPHQADPLPAEQPHLGLDDEFQFRCGHDLECFTRCCQDVSIVLTPYDVLRMKRALGISSSDFLARYTILPFTKEQKIPVVLLKMDPETRRCPFVTGQGCRIYPSRPWACRIYPLGLADPKNPQPGHQRFHFLIRESFCKGHEQPRRYTVRQWLAEQGVEHYEMMGASFKELMLHEFWDRGPDLSPQQIDMYFTACYDVDRFRRFVFETSFLELFDVAEERIEAMRTDDLELLEFGIQWLRFALFGEKTLRLRKEAAQKRYRAWQERQGKAKGAIREATG